MQVHDDLLAAFRDYLAGFGAPVAPFIAPLDWNMPAREMEAETLPVTWELGRCVELASERGQPLARLLASSVDQLCWRQTYNTADFGADFLDIYGWVEIFGTRGHFVNDTVAAGFLLLGPNITYPDHHHVAEEIYIPLTGGALWRKDVGGFEARVADEIIHHPSSINHAMRTGEEPLLALYLWRGGPLAQKSVIGKPAA
jgi:hypothetical protein